MTEVRTDEIRTDGDTQVRSLDLATIADYAEAMQAGDVFPPVKVVSEDGELWLVDGFHRLEAARRLVRETIEVQTVDLHVSRRWMALGWNATHGKRRTQADVRYEIRVALEEAQQWNEANPDNPVPNSDRAIARKVGCAATTVATVRANCRNPAVERVGADGRTRDTTNIGARPTPIEEARQEFDAVLPGSDLEQRVRDAAKPTVDIEEVRTAKHISDLHASNTYEWYTPSDIIEAARDVMGGIDLDPASCPAANEIVGAERIFTVEDDGLSQQWHGRVWLNPPFGRGEDGKSNLGKFVRKLLEEKQAGRVTEACLLVPSRVDASWWQELWEYPGVAFDKRIAFYGPEGEQKSGNTIGTWVFYIKMIGSGMFNIESWWNFDDTFCTFGNVVMPRSVWGTWGR